MSRRMIARSATAVGVSTLVIGALAVTGGPALAHGRTSHRGGSHGHRRGTTTPIKHLVVIFQENVSFDHYFATYPVAANVAGETLQGTGVAAPDLHRVAPHARRRSTRSAGAGLTRPGQPQQRPAVPADPGAGGHVRPGPQLPGEQKAYNGGLMDKFVENTSRDACTGLYGAQGLVMGYYDGNTVTGLWNYAQQYAMSDNSYSTTFGPSTPGRPQPRLRPDPRGALVRPVDPATDIVDPDAYTVRVPERERRRHRHRRPRPCLGRLLVDEVPGRWHGRPATSATCSTPRAPRGAGSRAASARRRARPTRPTVEPSAARPTRTSAA